MKLLLILILFQQEFMLKDSQNKFFIIEYTKQWLANSENWFTNINMVQFMSQCQCTILTGLNTEPNGIEKAWAKVLLTE